MYLLLFFDLRIVFINSEKRVEIKYHGLILILLHKVGVYVPKRKNHTVDWFSIDVTSLKK